MGSLNGYEILLRVLEVIRFIIDFFTTGSLAKYYYYFTVRQGIFSEPWGPKVGFSLGQEIFGMSIDFPTSRSLFAVYFFQE